jgi:hypothetical protein
MLLVLQFTYIFVLYCLCVTKLVMCPEVLILGQYLQDMLSQEREVGACDVGGVWSLGVFAARVGVGVILARTRRSLRLGGLRCLKMIRLLCTSLVFLERNSVSQLSKIICVGAEKPGQKVVMKKNGLVSPSLVGG